MNVIYWFIVSGFFVLFFLIIVPPLWKKRQVKEESSEQRNVRIAKEKAKDLTRQHKIGVLNQQQFDQQYEEIELSLADDLDADRTVQHNKSHGRWIIPVIVVIIPLSSSLIYFALGKPDALKKAAMVQAKPTQADINGMVQRLTNRLQQEPNNVKDWVMLGRLYKYLKQYDLAANTLANAYTLADDDPEIMLDYAHALAMTNQGKMTRKAAQLVFESLEKLPNSISGLWLAAIAKAEVGEFVAAMQYFQRLKTLLPPNSADLQKLQQMITALQSQIADSTAIKPLQASVDVSIEVKVSIDSAIQAKVSQSDTVFIYAKALTGSPMPLAIVKKQVSDLPLSVILNDSMAMIPTMKLSNFKAVKVIARISKSAAAMSQKGDYVGMLELKTLLENKAVAIVINEVIQ